LCSTSRIVRPAASRSGRGHHVLGLLRPHAGGRLVQQQQLGIGDQRDRDLQRPLLAMGEGLRRRATPRGQPDGASAASASSSSSVIAARFRQMS
jgi:hypothetical protein